MRRVAKENTQQGATADRTLFSALVESMTQMNEIARGERAPSRKLVVDRLDIQEIRQSTGLSQAQFAAVVDVQASTGNRPAVRRLGRRERCSRR
ncbi:MAG TPA: hypothetical protein VJ724_10045 [Tahibacter sp.]|nr:hypothetical protein [Tahibacter sp.]